MKTVLDLVLITVIVVIVIDISGFIDTIKSFIKKIITKGKLSSPDYSLKPIDCSFCMNFWVSLVYLIISNSFTLECICLVLVLSFLTTTIKDVLFTVKSIFDHFLYFINNKLD